MSLLPCPIKSCGGEAVVFSPWDKRRDLPMERLFLVACTKCGRAIQLGTHDEVMLAWNRIAESRTKRAKVRRDFKKAESDLLTGP